MNQVVLDEVLRSRIPDLSQPLDICDESGKVVAHVIPALDETQYEPMEPEISAEELQKRRQEPDYSTAEVLKYLEKL